MKNQEKATNTQRLLKVEEVAEILRATVFFVRSEIKAGKLIGAKIGRAFLVEATDLDKYINERKVKTSADNHD